MNFKLFLLSAATMVNAAYGETPVDQINLGTAGDFVILAKAGITNVADSKIKGDMGVSPIAATSMTGFGLIMDDSDEFSTSNQMAIGSKVYAPGYVGDTPSKLTTAVADMLIAYHAAAAVPVTGGPFPGNVGDETDTYSNFKGGEIGGETLTPGVYAFDVDVRITDGNLIFDGDNDDKSVFIIKTSQSVIQAADKKVILRNGAKAENIFWQVAKTVDVGANAHMEGTLLVWTAVKFITKSTLNGRILAGTAVTLQKNIITVPTPSTQRGLRGLQLA
jgi:hypothetical protein